jgi:hypothetical protein
VNPKIFFFSGPLKVWAAQALLHGFRNESASATQTFRAPEEKKNFPGRRFTC